MLALHLSRGIVALAGGRVIGTALATSFGPVATANMIIADRDAGGRGLGQTLMERAMALAAPAEWRLIATEAGRPLYAKLGFEAEGRIAQHQGRAEAVRAPEGVDWAGPEDMAEIAALDRAALGADRAGLIAALFDRGRVAAIRRQGRLAAWAARRDFGRGEVLGPVIAQDADQAQALLAFLCADQTGAFLRADVDEGTGLGPWLAAHGLTCVSGGVRMRRGAGAGAGPGFRARQPGLGVNPARQFADRERGRAPLVPPVAYWRGHEAPRVRVPASGGADAWGAELIDGFAGSGA